MLGTIEIVAKIAGAFGAVAAVIVIAWKTITWLHGLASANIERKTKNETVKLLGEHSTMMQTQLGNIDARLDEIERSHAGTVVAIKGIDKNIENIWAFMRNGHASGSVRRSTRNERFETDEIPNPEDKARE